MTIQQTAGLPRVFDGRFSDGRTAVSHDVRVTFDGEVLVISHANGMAQLRWPLKELEIAEHLTARSSDVMLHEPGRKGGTLYVADAGFVRDLAANAAHLTARSRRWQGMRPFVWVAGIAAAIAALVYVTDFSPARSLAKLMPHGARATLGREVVRSMSGGRRVCTQAAGKASLETLAKRLSEAAGSKAGGRKADFTVSVVDADVVNAFAAPGEQIVIMRKLIETADGPDEVAGVLAHEMGHGLELHPETGIIRSVGLMAATEIILGGSGGSLANVGLYLAQLGYSRQAERQADLQAIAILKRSGVATQGVMDFFKRTARMAGEERDGKSGKSADEALDMLRTHPSTAERLALFAGQPPYPATPALTDGEWQALKSICRTTSDPVPVPRKKKTERPRDI
jgi:beta-barrel assembly-enhancing protease